MSKHTLGPWITTAFCATNVDDCVGVKSDATLGAVAWIVGANNDETNANARLIAAAPDLLAALRVLLRDFEAVDEVADYGLELQVGMYQAHKAIAKATGGAA